ncbi:hypothetical protein C0Q70_05619 [Pomacea canaliculata]|uniref:Uncharacterized protein n=1 Tax=Pomacea canaliculata TaxID=400727 RepID=A0A2T7PLQ1_POMCA|nr:hypothetical protein C0Q70_05619 [Pomacea canaliculata]
MRNLRGWGGIGLCVCVHAPARERAKRRDGEGGGPRTLRKTPKTQSAQASRLSTRRENTGRGEGRRAFTTATTSPCSFHFQPSPTLQHALSAVEALKIRYLATPSYSQLSAAREVVCTSNPPRERRGERQPLGYIGISR